MSVFAEFALPAGAFPLGRALESVPDARIELERIVPVGESVLPFFWLRATERDVELFREAALKEPAVDRLAAVDRVAGQTLFRAEWTEGVDGVVRAVETARATVLRANGTAAEWHLELRFGDRADVGDFHRYCATHGIDVELTRLRYLVGPGGPETYGLTDIQLETLELAHERGYFREPREVSLAELAETLGVTERAVSRRLRRGTERLLANTIARER